MRLLDLFCGQGGAAMGYALAGWEVVGVDVRYQRHYPFAFRQGDAVQYLVAHGHEYDAIHASPPCQRYSALNRRKWGNDADHPDLIGVVRDLLAALDRPYVIENVPGAPLRDPILLCGSMFGLRIAEGALRRHRLFESNVPLTAPDHPPDAGPTIGVYGHGRGGGPERGRGATAHQARALMGMPWATRDGCAQAIPPAYTLHIGRQLARALRTRRTYPAPQQGYAARPGRGAGPIPTSDVVRLDAGGGPTNKIGTDPSDLSVGAPDLFGWGATPTPLEARSVPARPCEIASPVEPRIRGAVDG